VRISRLKKKMHDAGVPDPAIKSLWKEGYQLCVPVQIVP
jgi:DNA-binding response OmpR family regulator